MAELAFVRAEMSHKQMDDLFSLWAASFFAAGHESSAPFSNHRDLLSTIDAIDVGGAPWESYKIRYNGELPPDPPKWMTQVYWLYCRNSERMVRSQLENTELDGHIDYCAYEEYGVDGAQRFGDYFSGRFANRQSVSMNVLLFVYNC